MGQASKYQSVKYKGSALGTGYAKLINFASHSGNKNHGIAILFPGMFVFFSTL
jgi:hypothetical protein